MDQADKNTPPNAGEANTAQDSQQPGRVDSKDKLRFSEDQQEVVNTLIDRMYGKGFEKAKGEFEPKVSQLSTRVQELEKALEEARKAAPKAPEPPAAPKAEDAKPAKVKPSEDMQQLLARMEELQKAQDEIKRSRDEALQQLKKQQETEKKTRVKDSFLEAASAVDFVNPTQVFRLLEDELTFDEELGQVVAMNPKTGRPRMDATLENPLPLADFLSQWATTNKHFVRAADASGGTGAGESRRVPSKAPAKSVADMTPEEFEAYRQKVLLGR